MTSTVRRSSLVALTCVVSTVLTAPSPFRFHDAPEDEDTRVMRSFPKISFDDLQTQRYCYGHKEHFQNYCDGANALPINAGRLSSKLEKFCPSYVKHCPEEASKIAKAGPPSDMFREPASELIIPPSLPTAPEEVTQFDLPLPSGDTKPSETFGVRPLQARQLSADVVRT
ncbi:Protein OSM-11, partial [Aphelenchoides avenae]